VPLALDPSSRLTSIQWGGSWLGLVASLGGGIDAISRTTCNLHFPGPGNIGDLPLIQGGVPSAPNKRTLPYTLTTADLTSKVTAGNGTSLTGFAMATNVAAALYYLKLADPLPKTSFNLQFNVQGGEGGGPSGTELGANGLFEVWIVTSGFTKGADISVLTPTPVSSAMFATKNTGTAGPAGIYTFSVDPAHSNVLSLN
jgi:hypothetical protein